MTGEQPESSPTVLAGVRIVEVDRPGLPLTGLVDVTARSDRVVAISPHDGVADDAIDGGGRYLLPGLVNAHDHLYSKELRTPAPSMDIAAMRRAIDTRDEAGTFAVMLSNAWRAMAEGILFIRDMGARHGLNTRLAGVLADGVFPGPEIVAAGRPIVMTGGHVWTFGREADGPDDCRRAVREQRKAGARVIKVMASGGLSNFPHEDYTVCEFTDEELAAIIHEAHKLGLPTCAHAFGSEAVAAVVGAGIDSVEHGVHLTDELVATMATSGTGYVPTMANMARIASPDLNALAGDPARGRRFTEEIVRPQQASVARAVAAGVRVGVGTDSTGTYRDELAALMAAGMGTEQVLRAATIDGAEICRVDGGVVAAGKMARFALYETDPREDPLTLTEPAAVFTAGRLFSRPILGDLLEARR